jgi:heme-degrading monooxygenase HmoA
MWARISTYEGSPDSIDESVTYARETILPKARQLAGYRGIYLVADRQTGKSLSITLWDREDDLRASEAEADRLREDASDHVGDTIAGVERFEVVLHEFT